MCGALREVEEKARRAHVGMWRYGDPGEDSDQVRAALRCAGLGCYAVLCYAMLHLFCAGLLRCAMLLHWDALVGAGICAYWPRRCNLLSARAIDEPTVPPCRTTTPRWAAGGRAAAGAEEGCSLGAGAGAPIPGGRAEAGFSWVLVSEGASASAAWGVAAPGGEEGGRTAAGVGYVLAFAPGGEKKGLAMTGLGHACVQTAPVSLNLSCL